MSSEEGEGSGSSEATVTVVCALLVGCLQMSVWLSTTRSMRWLHESCAVLLVGTAVGLVAHYVAVSLGVKEQGFSRFFFQLLFPPVIFNAGFTLRKREFLANIGSVLCFAVLGTLISTGVVGGLVYVLGRYAGVGSGDLIESLIFGGLISSTDSVSTIAVFLEMNVDPLLYSIVFGESVLNDAVAIAICRTLSGFVGSTLEPISIWYITRDFFIILACSALIGAAVGFAWVAVKVLHRHKELSATYDITFILMFAYLAYSIADLLDLSGIISLFVCALVTSHYCWHTISPGSRAILFGISATLDYVSTVIVFFILGMLLFFRPNPWVGAHWHPGFMVYTVALVFFARAVNVFPLSFMLNLGRLYVTILFTNVIMSIFTRPLAAKLDVQGRIEKANVVDPMENRQDVTHENSNDGLVWRWIHKADFWVVEHVKQLGPEKQHRAKKHKGDAEQVFSDSSQASDVEISHRPREPSLDH
eukprot:m51a1_g11068 putative sodium hydrogen (475) ;mRNA; f:544013-545951